jgi:release factor glutamine methyltransferase
MNTNSSPTISKWLAEASKKLAQAGISTARLDCLVLLEDMTKVERSSLLAHPEKTLSEAEIKRLNDQITRRMAQEPLAYIRGRTEFYGRSFKIDHRVLEPRPESETMIDLLKRLPGLDQSVIADIGTGSGALAITAKLEVPYARVMAIDNDPKCLTVAKINAKNLGTTISFYKGDLIKPLAKLNAERLILLCNLPYVPDNFQINPAAMREPRQAIFGGPDGLDVYRKLFDQLSKMSNKSITVLTEALPPQHQALSSTAYNHGFNLQTSQDFIQQYTN